jgi:hypothetical protein
MLGLTAFTALVMIVGTSAPAHAYIDPGSGSYLLQLALAGILAVVFSLKMSWQRLRTNVAARFGSRETPHRGR